MTFTSLLEFLPTVLSLSRIAGNMSDIVVQAFCLMIGVCGPSVADPIP